MLIQQQDLGLLFLVFSLSLSLQDITFLSVSAELASCKISEKVEQQLRSRAGSGPIFRPLCAASLKGSQEIKVECMPLSSDWTHYGPYKSLSQKAIDLSQILLADLTYLTTSILKHLISKRLNQLASFRNLANRRASAVVRVSQVHQGDHTSHLGNTKPTWEKLCRHFQTRENTSQSHFFYCYAMTGPVQSSPHAKGEADL